METMRITFIDDWQNGNRMANHLHVHISICLSISVSIHRVEAKCFCPKQYKPLQQLTRRSWSNTLLDGRWKRDPHGSKLQSCLSSLLPPYFFLWRDNVCFCIVSMGGFLFSWIGSFDGDRLFFIQLVTIEMMFHCEIAPKWHQWPAASNLCLSVHY